MAPKSALITAGTTDFSKKRAPVHPLTTQGKIAKATAQAQNKKRIPREKPIDPNAKPKKKALPPPWEPSVVPKPDRAQNKTKRPSTPMTTQQKIAMANAKQRAKGGVPAAVKPSASDAKNKASAIPKPPLTPTLMSHAASVNTYQKKEGERRKVTMRRTQKAERFARIRRAAALKNPRIKELWESIEVKVFVRRAQSASDSGELDLESLLAQVEKVSGLREKLKALLDAGVLPGTASGLQDLTLVDLEPAAEAFRFMSLPKSVRAEIYDWTVVETKAFVRPDSPPGCEQPGLAMVDRKLRGEVLPIYYGKNKFAIDLAPDLSSNLEVSEVKTTLTSSVPKTATKRPATGLLAIAKWAAALQKGDWFEYIRHWVFDYVPPSGDLPAFSMGSGKTPHFPGEQDDESFTVSLDTGCPRETNKPGSMRHLEVHRGAQCLMPGFMEFEQCATHSPPKWLREAVDTLLDKAKTQGGVDGGKIVGLAKSIRTRVQDLADCRCDWAMTTIE
ncbi:hypothetical protein B0A50_06484 [Salinomyces thailandicus]|uniref:Uncharacterized protein n=1 Tax=Salinomyces thailandicus TaxID=706561 RepID=A0A4U0TPJ6_9PEZI|nr:hypothetical protein B0A50_06484 [Salinomyces thailandica]